MEPFNSFNINISSTGQPSPLKITTPGRSSLRDFAGLALLNEASDSVKREFIITWLQDNIVSLVGPDAAEALKELLDRPDAKNFVNKTVNFQILLERGIHTPEEAVQEWRRRHQK
jgi:hypothetical protein